MRLGAEQGDFKGGWRVGEHLELLVLDSREVGTHAGTEGDEQLPNQVLKAVTAKERGVELGGVLRRAPVMPRQQRSKKTEAEVKEDRGGLGKHPTHSSSTKGEAQGRC